METWNHRRTPLNFGALRLQPNKEQLLFEGNHEYSGQYHYCHYSHADHVRYYY